MSVIYSENEANSPSAYLRSKRQRENSSESQFRLSGKDAINIETKTLTKQIEITWSISKQTIDVAKLSSKGEKKGVIETSVKYHDHTFNLELCVPGWRRSQDGFSAFYLTVPRKTKLEKQRIRRKLNLQRHRLLNANDDRVRDDGGGDSEAELNQNSSNNSNGNNGSSMPSNEEEEEDNDFVARYSVSFGEAEQRVTRKSSIRNDFDLGVGFPNFTEVSTLMDSIDSNSLDFLIEVEIFECESTIRDRPFMRRRAEKVKSITSQLVEKMYYERLHCDAAIVANYVNAHNERKSTHIQVHKCILTAASPVFHTCFKHESKENLTSSIMMNQWNVNTIITMIKFLYLGKIQLFHAELDRLDDDGDNEMSVNQHDDSSSVHGLDVDDETESEAADMDMDTDKDNDVEINQAEPATQAVTERKEEEEDSEHDNDLYEEVKCAEMEDAAKQSPAPQTQISSASPPRDSELACLESQCPETARRLFALFQIAECYEIHDLSIACCYKLVSNITTHTCCIFLIYLDKYTHLDAKMREIKNYILDYIVRNIHSVKQSNGYLYLLKNKPDLLGELIVKITENVRN